MCSTDAYGLGLTNVTKTLSKLDVGFFDKHRRIPKNLYISNIILLNGLINLKKNDIKKIFDKK